MNDDGETRYRQTATFDVVILDDGIKEDTEAFNVYLYGGSGRYVGALVHDCCIELTINDNDPLAVTVDPGTLEIDEGASDTYDVVLDTQPAGDVTVTIDGVTGADLTLDKTTLTFTALDWNVPQTVTVTAEQDDDQADEPPVILTHTLSSLDVDLDDLSAAEVSVTVTDDDTAGGDADGVLAGGGGVGWRGCGRGAGPGCGGDDRRWSAEHRLRRHGGV